MKLRALVPLVLAAFVLVGFSGNAAAQKPIPGIKSTAPFKSLKRYVNVLQGKVNVPASAARKQQYRTNLSARRANANNKVKQLYKRRTTRIAKQDDNQERRDISRIRSAQKVQIQNLQNQQANRLNSLQMKENAAIARINARYAPRLDPLVNKRAALEVKLAKAKTPAKRNAIRTKINRTQTKINTIVNARQDDINATASRYDARAANVRSLFDAKISNVRAKTRQQIAYQKNEWKKIYRGQLGNAKERRTNEFELISNLRDRGAGYIDRMPPVNE
ncbi:MAG: hypothetical protein M3Y45_03750 [Actinomycetota bacterium]|nr:hypothetical protein [Actinomycetota bacterium]